MPKEKIFNKMYITIEPSCSWGTIRRSDLETMKDQILRHVDNVKSHDIDIVTEFSDVCSFCGARWTEDSPSYNGGCCAKDQENDPEYNIVPLPSHYKQ